MSGGAAASSVVSTPLAYKFDAKRVIAIPSVKPPAHSAALSSSLSSETAAVVGAIAQPAAISGWGDIFKRTPGEWKCETCTCPNPKEAAKCLSCETAKACGAAVNGVSVTDVGSRPVVKTSVSVIGPGGFSFGGAQSSSTGLTETGPKSLVVTGDGATPAKAKRDRDDGSDNLNAGIGVGGFLFRAAASSSHTPSSISRGTDFVGSEFSYNRPTATPANTPAKLKVTNETSNKSAVSLEGSGAALAASESESKASSLVGFSLGESASAPVPSTKISTSVGFSFGASVLGDKKKEDPVTAGGSTTGGFSFGAREVGEKKVNGASEPGFSFSVPPPAVIETTAAQEPLWKKTIFSFGAAAGSTSSLPISEGNGVEASKTSAFSFGEGGSKSSASMTVPKEQNAVSSNMPLLAFGNTSSLPKPTGAVQALAFGESKTTAEPKPSDKPGFAFGGQTAGPSTPAAPFAFGGGSTLAPAAEKKNEATITTSNTGFTFGATPAPSSKPNNGTIAKSPATFSFETSTPHAPSTSGGAKFSYETGATTLFTPAPSANPPPSSASGFMFGAGATPAAFGSTPSEFGNSSKPTVATPAPATTTTTFAFGAGLTPAAPSAGFGTTPSFGFRSNPQPSAPPLPGIAGTFGSFGNSVSAPNPTLGFMGGNPPFATAPSFMGAATTPSTSTGGGFSIGTGGTAKKTPGGRRIVKAKRPPSAR
ncbi:hypothetical protein ACHAXA_011855 [Cyclostephanos tholiformis]|uniref:RanBP2-type domain-containing protein n=1 Tax=Cyclostephanos tholiformis TaxID=382380 RepID=A0ABD3RWF7_9STRA